MHEGGGIQANWALSISQQVTKLFVNNNKAERKREREREREKERERKREGD